MPTADSMWPQNRDWRDWKPSQTGITIGSNGFMQSPATALDWILKVMYGSAARTACAAWSPTPWWISANTMAFTNSNGNLLLQTIRETFGYGAKSMCSCFQKELTNLSRATLDYRLPVRCLLPLCP